MTTHAAQAPEGYMQKANGNLVPIANIKDQDLLRNDVAMRLGQLAKAHSEALAEFKQLALEDMADLVSIAAERYNVKLGGDKGNLDVTTFDGQFKIQRKVSDNITYTEEIHAAKALIDECVKSWSEGANANLITAVDNVFRTNKQGELVTSRIMEMLRWNIQDKQWIAAMEAVTDSILVNSSTTYINVYERDDNGKYQAIPLSLAGV